MHLKTLKLQDFKSHKETVIEFAPITTIVGANDAGKTSLLRALKLILHHEDWPDTPIRYECGSCTVHLELTNGTIIERTKTDKSQQVSLTVNGKTEVFRGKKDAGDFVRQHLGIYKVVLDKITGPEDLNFIGVYDGPALLTSRSDVVQRKFSSLAGGAEIEDAKNILASEVKDLVKSITAEAKRIFPLAELVDKNQQIIKKANTSFQSIKESYAGLHDAVEKYNQLENVSAQLHKLTPINNTIFESVLFKFQQTKSLSVELNSLDSKLKLVEKTLALQAKPINFSTKLKECKVLAEQIELLTKLDELQTEVEDYTGLERGLLLELASLKTQVEICPTCKRVL
jgi:DNA repair exonuclease SbcCD ATPase subunit